jgi:hypothetical protein
MAKDVKEELKNRLIKATADRDTLVASVDLDVPEVYANPKAAFKKMSDFIADKRNDEAALAKKLETDPGYFGKLRGGGLSGVLTAPGRGDKATAARLAATLPSKVKAMLDADRKVLELEKAYYGPGGSGSPEGRDGPDR